jgi:rRNA large subunit m3Psi methyltransferase RlmH
LRVTIVSVGHKMPAWIQEGFHEYARRMPPEIRVELVELKPEERGAAKSADKAKAAEGARILAAVPSGATVLALDERGKSVSTQGLSVMLSEWMRDGSHPLFVIGAAGRAGCRGEGAGRQARVAFRAHLAARPRSRAACGAAVSRVVDPRPPSVSPGMTLNCAP